MSIFDKNKDKEVKTLNRKDIFEAQDIELEAVPTPEWGGQVYVKGMSGTQRDAFEVSLMESKTDDVRKNMKNFRSKLLVKVVCDENGKRLFTEKDIRELGLKSAKVIDRLYSLATEFSGIGEKDVEELTEALEENPLEDSASD